MPPTAGLDPAADPLFTQYVGALEYLRGLLSTSASTSGSSVCAPCTPCAAPLPAAVAAGPGPLGFAGCERAQAFDAAQTAPLPQVGCLQLVAAREDSRLEARVRRLEQKSRPSLAPPLSSLSASGSTSTSSSELMGAGKRRRCTRYGIDDILAAEADAEEDADVEADVAGRDREAEQNDQIGDAEWPPERERDARLMRGLSGNLTDRPPIQPSQYAAHIARVTAEEQRHQHPVAEMFPSGAVASELLDAPSPSLAHQQHVFAALLRQQQQQFLPQHQLALISPSQPPLPPLVNPMPRKLLYPVSIVNLQYIISDGIISYANVLLH